jgi:uncharacterized protein (TIGR02687 family)
MSADQRVAEALTAALAHQQAVFWHDVDSEFVASVAGLPLGDGVQLVKLDEVPALQVKLDIEAGLQAGGDQRWLLYSNQPEPDPAQDWLLDIRLRSRAFRADSMSMLLEDLGLTTLSLAPHLKLRGKFLRARERVERLKRLVLPDDDAEALDRKMMAVLLRSDESDALALAMRLLHGLWLPAEERLGEAPKAWAELEAMDLAAGFWLVMKAQLGYEATVPSLPDLLTRVLVTDFARGLRGPCPATLQHLALPDRVRAANASVLAARWRTDVTLHPSYVGLAGAVAGSLQLDTALAGLAVEELLDCVTFPSIDKRIVSALKGRIGSQGGAALEGVRAVAGRRRDGPWANRLLAHAGEETRALAACYDALEAAAEFLALKDRWAEGLSFATADEALVAYRDQLFAFDQLYRRVHHAADQVEPTGWSLLHSLRDQVEAAYSGWFMPQLGAAWARVLEGPQGLLATWRSEALAPQQRFFDDWVAGPINSGAVQRLFVVISDALRFEVAEELARDINRRNRLNAHLEAQLGVLPSYTSLGMAALLPHQSLAYRAGGEVWADGAPTATLEARDALLARYGGMAIRAEELLALGKLKGRERVKDRRVVYVYHDRIDLLGDKQASEGQTFEAVAQTITELQAVVSFIVNNLNGSTVLVTADHGFIYQEAALDGADKAALGDKPDGTVIAKKRYLLGRGLPGSTRVWAGNTAVTAGTQSDAPAGDGSLDFWLPKGTARFHFAGGARFVHGSAMPQEVVVPVLTVRENETAAGKIRQVALSLLGASNKVVTNTQRFEFVQSEAVSERVLPRTVLVSLRDGQELVSDEVSLTLDSPSASLNDRVRSVFLTVRSGSYDRHRDHFLVARDAVSKIEVLRMPMRIDLAFSNDF